MCTLLRMTCESEVKLVELIKAGERMESLRKGAFPGLRKNSNWFACRLANASDFEFNLCRDRHTLVSLFGLFCRLFKRSHPPQPASVHIHLAIHGFYVSGPWCETGCE
jgi:hypothetical protein